MAENSAANGRRGFRARITGGMLVIFLALLFISFLYAYIIRPVLSGWEPIFVLLFGDIKGGWNDAPKIFEFLLFSCGATVVSAIIIDAAVNSRYFVIVAWPFYKIPFIKRILSFLQSNANAYRSLKQARSVLLRIGGIEIPAFVTKERIFFIDGRKTQYLVLYCPHTPTFFTGNTIYIQTEKAVAGAIVDVPRGELVEDVVSAGIFGVREKLRTRETTTE